MEWFSEHAWQAWLGLAAVLGAAELLTLDLTLLMISFGALAGMLAAMLGAGVALQVVAGLVVAVASLALLRPNLIKRLHHGPELTTGHNKLVGRQGIVTAAISAGQSGQIKLAGEIWTAQPYDETLVIAPGQTVEVFEIRGATAYVHPVASLGSPGTRPES